MIAIENTIIDINLQAKGYEEIYQNLQVIYTTPVGTVAFDREFGIDIDVLDNPIPIAKGRLIVELIEKTRKYEPRAIVKEVTFKRSEKDGKLIPKVVIEIDS